MKIESTNYYKGRDGYQADSYTETDANGKIWHISTYKGRGKVYTTASQGQDNGGGAICYNLSGMMGGDSATYFSKLAEEAGQCNEAKVKRVHEAGLKAFLDRIATQPEAVKPYTIEPGQIIFENHDRKTTRVIFETTKPGHYKAVNLEGTQIDNVSMIEKGDYTEGNLMDLEQVNELVNQAHEAQRERSQKAEQAATLAAIERNQKIAIGIKIVPCIPEGVKAVIVANLRQDESDLQSDYFNASTIKTVYLAWSAHDKNVFSELRKAAAKFEETKEYSTRPAMPEGEKAEYWTAPDEHRENYTGGHGYYLGESSYHGWNVRKCNLGQYGPDLEKLQIAAAEGRFFCNVEPQQTESATPPQHEALEVTAGTVQIVEHPIRKHKILVIGDTKPIKETLKTIKGAWWNRFEKGWEFKREQLAEIETALKSLRKPQEEPTPEPEAIEPEPTPDEVQAIENEITIEQASAPVVHVWEAEKRAEEAEAEDLQRTLEKTWRAPQEPKKQFCNPTTAPAFLTANVTQEEVKDREFMESLPTGTGYTEHRPNMEQETRRTYNQAPANGLSLYSEHQRGTNTGRAQQGFLF